MIEATIPIGYEILRIGSPRRDEEYLRLNGDVQVAAYDFVLINMVILYKPTPPCEGAVYGPTTYVTGREWLVGNLWSSIPPFEPRGWSRSVARYSAWKLDRPEFWRGGICVDLWSGDWADFHGLNAEALANDFAIERNLNDRR